MVTRRCCCGSGDAVCGGCSVGRGKDGKNRGDGSNHGRGGDMKVEGDAGSRGMVVALARMW